MTPELRRASYPQDKAALERIFTEYLDFLFFRAPEHEAAMRSKYPPERIPALVAEFAAEHLTARGELLLAETGRVVVGCGMMRELEPGIVEIQRVFVSSAARGKGLGRRLTLALMDKARADGQLTARLDTGPGLHEAIALYTDLGFTRRAAYRKNPALLEEVLLYFEAPL